METIWPWAFAGMTFMALIFGLLWQTERERRLEAEDELAYERHHPAAEIIELTPVTRQAKKPTGRPVTDEDELEKIAKKYRKRPHE